MCVAFFLWEHPQLTELQLVALFNRDEVLGRWVLHRRLPAGRPARLGSRATKREALQQGMAAAGCMQRCQRAALRHHSGGRTASKGLPLAMPSACRFTPAACPLRCRPTAASHFWRDRPCILGGRDLVAGGTWLCISRHGRAAFLTNFREVRLSHVSTVPAAAGPAVQAA